MAGKIAVSDSFRNHSGFNSIAVSDSFWNHSGFIHFEEEKDTAILYSSIETTAVSKLIRDRNNVMKPVWFQNESKIAILTHRRESNDTRHGNYKMAWWHPPDADLQSFSVC